jgi:hypothetical protein
MQKRDFIPHRRFLNGEASFIQVTELRDKNKMGLIHFTFRLNYLKDCALAYFLDETQVLFLRIIVKNCYSEFLRYVEVSKDFLTRVVDELRHYNLNALKFIHEMCSILREYQDVINRVGIYEKLN